MGRVWEQNGVGEVGSVVKLWPTSTVMLPRWSLKLSLVLGSQGMSGGLELTLLWGWGGEIFQRAGAMVEKALLLHPTSCNTWADG